MLQLRTLAYVFLCVPICVQNIGASFCLRHMHDDRFSKIDVGV